MAAGLEIGNVNVQDHGGVRDQIPKLKIQFQKNPKTQFFKHQQGRGQVGAGVRGTARPTASLPLTRTRAEEQ